MKFDYTYIVAWGHIVFEPMIIVSNTILLVLSLIFFRRLISLPFAYSRGMGWFMLMVGISAIFGAICHSVHYQNGKRFFDLMFFGMNGFSLLSAHFCARASYFLASGNERGSKKVLAIWNIVVLLLLVYAFVLQEFVLVKAVAGTALAYTLVVHIRHYVKSRSAGSRLVIAAIASSVLSLLVHSAHLSLHEWFNYKDIAHVFMIVAQVLFYLGAYRNCLSAKGFSAEQTAL